MPPYPYDPDYQLAFFWFLGVLELVIFLSLVGTVFNQYRLHRGRFILLTFLASAQAIVYKVIDRTYCVQACNRHFVNTSGCTELLFFSRQEAPKQLYGASRLYTALAGAIILSIGNGVTVIGLGLVEVRWRGVFWYACCSHKVFTTACGGSPCVASWQ